SRRGAGGALWPLSRQVRSGGGAGKLLPYDFDADGRLDLPWANANTVRLALSRTFDPAGTAIFGAGTPGCLGRASPGTVEPARIGNADFRLLANHLPPGGTGWRSEEHTSELQSRENLVC